MAPCKPAGSLRVCCLISVADEKKQSVKPMNILMGDGITDAMLTEDARRSTIDALADWTLAADKVLVF